MPDIRHTGRMGNKPGLVRAVLTLVFLTGFAWLVLRPHEPVYQGKPLSFWLQEAYASGAYQIEGTAPETEHAIREMGANAVPDLLHLVGSANSWPEQIMGTMSDGPKLAFLHLPSVDYRPEMAIWAFERLGAAAKPGVPGLIKLLKSKDSDLQVGAARCLARIGPAAEPAVPALLAAWKKNADLEPWVLEAFREIGPGASPALPRLAGLTNSIVAEFTAIRIKRESCQSFIDKLADASDSQKWRQEATFVGELGTNAESAVPFILQALKNTNTVVQSPAIVVLGQIHRCPEACVPALIPFLKSTNWDHRLSALKSLAAFGSDARPAAKELQKHFSDGYPPVQQMVTNALRVIDPEALARVRNVNRTANR